MDNYFGLKKEDYEACLNSSKRARYSPSEEAKERVSKKYNLSLSDSDIVLKLINSPARGTFTFYDVMLHLKNRMQSS